MCNKGLNAGSVGLGKDSGIGSLTLLLDLEVFVTIIVGSSSFRRV